MGRLNAALTDRAHVVRTYVSGERFDDASPVAAVALATFPCRVVPVAGLEREDGRRSMLTLAEIVCAGHVDVLADDQIEVEGGAAWKVTGDPLRVGRALVISVAKVTEPATDSVLP